MMLPVFTIANIRSWNPCYDPTRYLPEGWQGTALDILAVEDCPARDRLWVALREECIDARTLRLFAVWCARQALALIDDPDPRSVAALDTVERFANGEATVDELAAARAAAGAAAGDAEEAAWAAAETAARAAAWDAASAAASGAAGAAASGAAWYAAEAVASGAASADAWAVARAAASDAQVVHLHEMLLMMLDDLRKSGDPRY